MKIDDEFAAMKIVRSNPTPIINKKKARTRKTSDSHRKRLESNSSNSDLDCSVDLLSPEKVDFDDLVERDQTVEVITILRYEFLKIYLLIHISKYFNIL